MYTLEQAARMVAHERENNRCLNGHDPEFLEIRGYGATVCTKCRDEYGFKARRNALHPDRTPNKESNENGDTR